MIVVYTTAQLCFEDHVLQKLRQRLLKVLLSTSDVTCFMIFYLVQFVSCGLGTNNSSCCLRKVFIVGLGLFDFG